MDWFECAIGNVEHDEGTVRDQRPSYFDREEIARASGPERPKTKIQLVLIVINTVVLEVMAILLKGIWEGVRRMK